QPQHQAPAQDRPARDGRDRQDFPLPRPRRDRGATRGQGRRRQGRRQGRQEMKKPANPSVMRARLPGVAAIALLGLALAGCTDDVSEIQAWMDETRANTPRRTVRIAEPKRFVPFRYEARVDVDPFSNAKLQVALA